MHIVVRACLVICVAGPALPASAESLRCNGYSAAEGDSKISVLYKCGPPVLTDNYCAPVYYAQTLQTVPEPFACGFVPC